jgi:MATE family multidrug resistance protein
MVSFSIMTVVDTLLVGRLGTSQLAGVGVAGTTAFMVFCFSLGLLQGVKTLVAQAIGAQRSETVRSYLGAALVTALVLGVGTIGVGELVAHFIARVTATAAAGRAAEAYLSVRILSAPIVMVQVALREVRQATGDSRSPMFATVVANIVNVGLAILFIFSFGWGVRGAALATVIAHTVEMLVLIAVQHRRGGFGLRSFGRIHVVELARMGLPTGLQFTLELGSFTMLTLAVSTFSENDMAAHQIAMQVFQFSFLPSVAVGEAAAVLAGQAVGANRDDLVRSTARTASAVAMTYAGVCSTTMLVFGKSIVAAFTEDRATTHLAERLLLIGALFGVFDAANIIARCVLRGTGDVRFAAVVGVVVAWVSTPPLAWGLGHGLGLGAVGGWMGIFLEILVSMTILVTRVERRGWVRAAEKARARLRGLRDDREAGGEPAYA